SFNEPLKKSSTGYHSSAQTIDWVIEYNYNLQTVPVADASIVDTFDTDKLELDHTTFKVYPVTINASGTATVGATAIDPALYNVTDTATGFTLDFTGPDPITDAYRIEYVTKVIPRIYANETVTNTVNALGATAS